MKRTPQFDKSAGKPIWSREHAGTPSGRRPAGVECMEAREQSLWTELNQRKPRIDADHSYLPLTTVTIVVCKAYYYVCKYDLARP